ncbi:hypothetical protein [Treponema pedis]|uniref:hypothetical protein n=1 Tax=Treponema pedis TaxID=409322 RepID=UPI0003F7D1A8|nr:hypothetical protein [Treponema pedis]
MKKHLFTAFFIFMSFVLSASEVIEIPFYYDNEKKSIFVYAEIAGKKGYFLFDTGTFASLIFDKKENYNNFKVVAENYSLIIGGVQDSVSVYSIDDVVLAGNTLKINSYFMVSDNPNMGKDYIGIIGLNVFKDKIFEISMTDSVIRIYDKKPDEYNDFLPIQNYSSVELKIFIPIIIDGKTYNAFVDTGASYGGCILLSPTAHNIKKSKQFKIKTLSGYDSFIVETGTVEVMGIKFKNEDFTTHSIGLSEDIIGMEFLALFDMLFDLRNEKKAVFYYKPRYPYEYFNFFIGNSGLENIGIYHLDIFDQNRLIVTSLIENSPVWKAGLRPGTIITRLNSKKVSEYSIEGIKILIGGSSNLKITYIDSNGKEKTVQITPEKLL